MKSALYGGQAPVADKQLNRVDALSVYGRRKREACQPQLIVNQHTASTALAAVAARFRSGQTSDFPQIIQQQDVIRNRIAACAAVERDLENARHASPSTAFQIMPALLSASASVFNGNTLDRATADAGYRGRNAPSKYK